MVVSKVTSESLSTVDGTHHIEFVNCLHDQLVVGSLVISLIVAMLRILFHGLLQVVFAQRNDLRNISGFKVIAKLGIVEQAYCN